MTGGGYTCVRAPGPSGQGPGESLDIELDPNDYINFRVENGSNNDTLNSADYLTFACIAKIS